MEEFVRRWNMDGVEREWPPMPSQVGPDRRGLINEAGFLCFSMHVEQAPKTEAEAITQLENAFETSYRYIYGSKPGLQSAHITVVEKLEAMSIASNLLHFFEKEKAGERLFVNPGFKGSGLISTCAGDVMIGSITLFEVKGGERKFRSIDYRQVAIYAALYFAEKQEVIREIGLVNPRTGLVSRIGMEEFAREVSGQPAVTFLQSLLESFSGSLVSR